MSIEKVFTGNEKELKPIPDFKGYYVDAWGNVYSTRRAKKGWMNKKAVRLDKDGYPRTTLFKNGKRIDLTIHIIVANTWIRKIKSGEEVNHLDGNILNSHFLNLEIGTRRKNTLHSINVLGSSKLTFLVAQEIRELRKTSSITLKDLSIKYDVSQKTIECVVYNKIWKPKYHETR